MHSATLILWASSLVTLTVAFYPGAVPVGNQATYDEKFNNNKTEAELTSIFSSSIIYWDLDKSENISDSMKQEMKQDIMKDLVHISLDSQQCFCPRTLDTLVCDSTGKLHGSICRFHCRFSDTQKEEISPIMILTETAFQKSKKMCQDWYNRSRDGTLTGDQKQGSKSKSK